MLILPPPLSDLLLKIHNRILIGMNRAKSSSLPTASALICGSSALDVGAASDPLVRIDGITRHAPRPHVSNGHKDVGTCRLAQQILCAN